MNQRHPDFHRRVAACIPPQEDELYRIAVPWDVARTNQNAHRRLRATYAEIASGQRVGLYYWRIDRRVFDERLLVQWWVLRERRLDDVNAMAGLKALEDGMFRSSWHEGEGFVPDDDHAWVEWEFVKQLTAREWGKAKAGPWVVVVIRRHPDQSGGKRRAALTAPRKRPMSREDREVGRC